MDSAITYLVNEKLSEKRDVDYNIRDLEGRVSGFSKIKNEIEIEINTLSLNEEARRVFTSFNDICSNKGCQLFLSSSESYGKNLLYLRDQIKDLDRNTKSQEIRLDELRSQSKKIASEIEALKTDQLTAQADGSTKGLVNAISQITKSIIDLQSEKEVVERIEAEKTAYVELLNKRERLHDDIASMDSTGHTSDLRIIEFRSALRAKLEEWLDVLSTKNVSRDITVDSDFNILFGTEKVSQFSGSTLLRVVLAIKAAFFDIYISKDSPAIEFIIFDTPRQHDIESEHFAAFIRKLKEIVKNNSGQIIFSTTEYHYDTQENDIEWIPTFPGKEQNMFLGLVK